MQICQYIGRDHRRQTNGSPVSGSLQPLSSGGLSVSAWPLSNSDCGITKPAKPVPDTLEPVRSVPNMVVSRIVAPDRSARDRSASERSDLTNRAWRRFAPPKRACLRRESKKPVSDRFARLRSTSSNLEFRKRASDRPPSSYSGAVRSGIMTAASIISGSSVIRSILYSMTSRREMSVCVQSAGLFTFLAPF